MVECKETMVREGKRHSEPRIPQMENWVKLFGFDPTAPNSAVAKRLLTHGKAEALLTHR